jgi:hypothetical protein
VKEIREEEREKKVEVRQYELKLKDMEAVCNR